MTATMHIWIRTSLAALTLVLFIAAPALVRSATSDDGEQDATPHVEQSSPDERSNHPRPARSLRRDLHHPISLATDLDTLVPPPRPTTDDDRDDDPDTRDDTRDDGDADGDVASDERDRTRDGTPGTDTSGDARATEDRSADGDADGASDTTGDDDERRGSDTGGRRPRPVGDELHLADLDLDETSARVTPPDGFGLTGGDTGRSAPESHGPSNIKIPTDCSVQCITGASVYARGVGVRLAVTTNTPATFAMIVWNNDTGYSEPRHGPLFTQEFKPVFDDLESGTTYQVYVAATDAQGHVSQASGEFTTLRRNVTVSYEHVELFESPYTGAFHTHRQLNGEWVGSSWHVPYAGGNPALNDGVMLLDVEQELSFAFQLGQLHDHDAGSGCEPMQWHFPKADQSGTTCTSVYNTIGPLSIDLDVRPPGATSWLTHSYPFTPTSSIQAPSFQLHTNIKVNYVP